MYNWQNASSQVQTVKRQQKARFIKHYLYRPLWTPVHKTIVIKSDKAPPHKKTFLGVNLLQ